MTSRGFTLIELLVALALIAVLATITMSALGAARDHSHTAACASRLRSLGTAVHLYAQDHDGAFPRSFHSAAAHREPGWCASLAPYLGVPAGPEARWEDLMRSHFRCPADPGGEDSAPGYGLNVFFELGRGDSYLGRPATWRRVVQVPAPQHTILLAELDPATGNDHFMCHQWSGAAAAKQAVAHDRHRGSANYLFVDGHIERLPVEKTFTSRTQNLWNPSIAAPPPQ
jgi:prepilin-type N-terminal cleavage/methylation domain-containing protein/prepilin-type processing-associated H-X9-DG protein